MFEFLKRLFKNLESETMLEEPKRKFQKQKIRRNGQLDLEANALLLGEVYWNADRSCLELYKLVNGNYLIYKIIKSYSQDQNDSVYMFSHRICKTTLDVLDFLEYSHRGKQLLEECELEIVEKLED